MMILFLTYGFFQRDFYWEQHNLFDDNEKHDV